MMIDFNDIICVLKGGDAIDKVMNIFLQWTPLQILDNTWISLMNFMNLLWSLQPTQWSNGILEFF